jgi:hypothetical protein
LYSITLVLVLADRVIFLGPGEITVVSIFIEEMVMALPKTSALTVIPQVNNLDNRDTDLLWFSLSDNLSSKVTVLVGIITM